MKKLNVTWDGIDDPTGYLFSFAKALSCAVKNSPWSDLAEDIIATSGFAFRMWVNPELCPSAMSIWEFNRQPEWILNGGLETAFVSCCFQPDNVLKQARTETLPKIKESIDRGIPAVAWDIGVLEWGLITGYDDVTERFTVLPVTGVCGETEYSVLGNREMPMLNVVTVTGKTGKNQDDIVNDTVKLAKSHLLGEEWCENIKGLECYPALTDFFEREDPTPAASRNMEYFLGTFGACKLYAWRFFDKYGLKELAGLYKTVYESWQAAFDRKKTDCDRAEIAGLLKRAYECEKEAVKLM